MSSKQRNDIDLEHLCWSINGQIISDNMLCNFLWVFTFWDFSFLNQSYNLTVSLKVNLIIVHFHYKMGHFPKSWGQTAWGPFKLYQIICESLNRFDAQLIYLKRGMKEVMSCEFYFHLPKNLPSDDFKLLWSTS